MIVTTFPKAVRVIEHTLIPLKDGTMLAARIWLPDDAEQNPVPAILEYLPYRKRDGTYERDALTHPYLAGHGYAGVRVDLRGCGESTGLLFDEYAQQEQDDGVEVIAWLAAQPWCNGSVGMMGISWGGFNGLQIAARRPPALKAIVTICSTDDRYADDAHYMGGTFLTTAGLEWAFFFFSLMCLPPDPALVGDSWRAMWLERLQNIPLFQENWLQHQRRDAYWKHGSVCEDYTAIQCPVYAVGGWTDGYKNAIPRLLEGLKVPRKGLIGPWAHAYPHFALPGPQIGFLQEILRWWDHWLKGRRYRRDGRTHAAGVDDGKRETGGPPRHIAGPVDCRTFVAAAGKNAAAAVLDRCGVARCRGTFDGSCRVLAADGRQVCRRLGSLRTWARSGTRPARR